MSSPDFVIPNPAQLAARLESQRSSTSSPAKKDRHKTKDKTRASRREKSMSTVSDEPVAAAPKLPVSNVRPMRLDVSHPLLVQPGVSVHLKAEWLHQVIERSARQLRLEQSTWPIFETWSKKARPGQLATLCEEIIRGVVIALRTAWDTVEADEVVEGDLANLCAPVERRLKCAGVRASDDAVETVARAAVRVLLNNSATPQS